jgi:DNA repair exonuclease SbcCD ATPase subunit
MNIYFSEVKWKNLLSYGDNFTTLEFNNGIDLVLGTNGKGKSSFADAIFYGLFGKPFRKIKSLNLINRGNKKKLEVQIKFSVDESKYKIVRGMKPSKFEIYEKKDDSDEYVIIEQRAATKDYQKMLEEDILKFNETVFRQLMVLGSNLPNSKPFMDLSSSEKEQLFQTLTDTSIFGYLKGTLKNKISDLKILIKDYEYKRDILSSSITSEKSMIEQAERQNDDFEKNHNENIKLTEENIRKVEEDIKRYNDALDKLRELKIKYDEKNQEISVLTFDLNSKKEENETKILRIQEDNMKEYQKLLSECTIQETDVLETQKMDEEILKLKLENQELSKEKMDLDSKIKYIEASEKSSIPCKSCKTINYLTDICDNEVHKKEEYLARIKNIKVIITNKTEEIKKLEFKLRDFKKSIQNKLQENKDGIQSKKETMDKELLKIQNKLQINIEPYEKEIRELRVNNEKIKEALLNGKRIKENLQEQEKSLEFYVRKLDDLRHIKKVQIDYESLKEKKILFKNIQNDLADNLKSKEDYTYLETIIDGNNLKGAVIKKQIPFLNKGINHFLELFSMLEYSFVINENFKERLISRDVDSEFGQLSNGQKVRISFSIMFAFLMLIEQRNGVKTNLLVLDEVLDSSIDASGREELLQILKSEFAPSKDIIIISHNQEIKEKIEIFDRLIHIDKDKFSALKIEKL